MLLVDFSKDGELNEYIRNIRTYALTSAELSLLLKSSEYEDKQRFIKGYLIRVVKYAINIHAKLTKYFDMPYSIMDFIQEGNEVLVKLIYSWESEDFKKFNFVFYTKFKRNIIQNLLPLSHNIANGYMKFIEKIEEYFQKKGCYVSFESFGQLYGIGVRKVKTFESCFIQNQSNAGILDENKIPSSEISTLDHASYLITRKLLLEAIEEVDLTEREKDIIIRHFGFNTEDYMGCNLETRFVDLAREYNVSPQCILQLYNRAIEKIKKNEVVMKKLQLCKTNVI